MGGGGGAPQARPVALQREQRLRTGARRGGQRAMAQTGRSSGHSTCGDGQDGGARRSQGGTSMQRVAACAPCSGTTVNGGSARISYAGGVGGCDDDGLGAVASAGG